MATVSGARATTAATTSSIAASSSGSSTPSGTMRSRTGTMSAAGDQRRGMMARQVVERRAFLPPQFEQVGESGRGAGDDARAASLEQQVGDDGRAVRDDRPAMRAPGRTRSSAASTPSARSSGTLSTLAVCTDPSGATAARSVNVPPTSMPTAIEPGACVTRAHRRRGARAMRVPEPPDREGDRDMHRHHDCQHDAAGLCPRRHQLRQRRRPATAGRSPR